MNITFITESLNQYRTGWFEHLSTIAEPRVSVLFMRVERDRPWDASIPAPPRAARIPSVNMPLRGYGTVTFLRDVERHLAQSSPDMVVLPGWGQVASYQVARWCLRHRVPYAVLFETWTPQKTMSLPTSVTDPFRRWMLDRSTVRMPASQRALGYLRSLGFDGTVVHSNVCDVDAAMRNASVDKTPGSDGPFTVLYCGRLMATKGVNLVLETAALCASDGIRFVIMGSGPLEPEVRSVVLRSPWVEYVGSVSGTRRFSVMAQSNALLLPSFVEPWGVVVQEALAVGTPVVVSPNVGCIPEFVEGADTGLIADTSAPAIRSAILELRGRVDADASLSSRCMEAARRHTYETAAGELALAVSSVP